MTYWCEHAWLGSDTAAGVRVEVRDGRIESVEAGVDPAPDDERLAGVVLPGLADAHAHAFHRALRGRTHDQGGDFWSWRQQMYAVAAALDPDTCLALARATYAELALSGVTCVAEFSYLHHAPGGRRYDEPNVMGHALEQAAREAGIRLTLLDTCYLAGGLAPHGYLPADAVQQRFSDGSASAWAERVSELEDTDSVHHGAAIHSVRAVPADQLGEVVAVAKGARCTSTCPSSRRRTRHAWRSTVAPPRCCWPSTGCWARTRQRCTPAMSTPTTSPCSVGPRPRSARAPAPRPTSRTASARSAG
jgi:formiminoglutamate deiminase